MTFQFRRRRPPIDRGKLYGEFLPDMARGTWQFDRIVDRAAYMFVTGTYPSHLRSKAQNVLTQISHDFPHPVSLDGRIGRRKLDDDAVRDLGLENHDMVKTVRDKVSQGYRIELGREGSNRRGFSKVFMFKWDPYPTHREEITVTVEGAIKDGWN